MSKKKDEGAKEGAKTSVSPKRVELQLRGVTPLLCYRMTEDELLKLRDKSHTISKVQLAPREDAARRLYLGPKGEYIWPAHNMMAAFIAAGTFIPLEANRRLSNSTSTLVPSFIEIEDLFLPILDPANDWKQHAMWEVDLRQGRNPNAKSTAICICRPRFDAWGLRMSLLVASDEIHMHKIRHLIELAGRRFGIGAFRPQRRGTFGKFVIDGWKETDLDELGNAHIDDAAQ